MVYRIFTYLKKYYNTEIVFDLSFPEINAQDFERKDQSCSKFSTLINQQRELYPRAPVPYRKGFVIRGKVDLDYASDVVTRWSRTSFIVYLNRAPIYQFSKKQTSIKTLTFGSEFTAIK